MVASLTLISFISSGCVYFNAFYHARQWFNQAEKTRNRDKRDKAGGGETKLYQDAIKKSSKVISDHPNSSYVDDALFIIGKSYYYLGDYPKAERKFRELLANFPKSGFREEANFFLGKSRFQMENYDLAREIFTAIINNTKSDRWRPDALYLMGESSLNQFDTTGAIDYFEQFVKEYKSNSMADDVQLQIGEIHFASEDYDSALSSFTKAVAMAPDEKTKFQIRYEVGRTLFQLDSTAAGLKLFRKLLVEDTDTMYAGDIQLRIAEGMNLVEDQRDAILLFDDISTKYDKKPQQAEALYRTGVIVQDDWADLGLAKDLFDQASKVQLGGDWSRKALLKSTDIAKVEKYQSDLAADKPEEADDSRFMLAELYRTTLNLPDSAMAQYQSLLDDFPGSDLAPKSLIAIGWLFENHFHEPDSAKIYYQRVLDEYASSDEYSAALKLQDRESTPSDSLYPDKIYSLAEQQYFDLGNPDSAVVLFNKIIDQFPESRLAPRADFAIARIKLDRFVPEEKPDDSTYVDSSMFHVFREISEKYPDSPYGKEAARLVSGEVLAKAAPQVKEEKTAQVDSSKLADSTQFAAKDTVTEAQRAEAALRNILDVTPQITIEKPTVEGQFTYPLSATGSKFEGKILMKIKIDFTGRVSEVVILKGSNNQDIDREVTKAMLETYFNPIQFDPLKINGYFIYNYEVKLPEVYR